jgi:hypothetical protein
MATFADAVNALVAERDRQFVERICKEYNLDFAELNSKYLETAEMAIKVPRKYKKREAKVTVTTDGEPKAAKGPKGPKEPKAPKEKQCCTASTSKKEPCKFSALKGEVFCKRHLKQSLGETGEKEPKAPKVPKAAKKVEKALEPVHTHALTTAMVGDCELCQTHGNAMGTENDADIFELVTALAPVMSVENRLAAILADADEPAEDSDSELLDEEAYDEE